VSGQGHLEYQLRDLLTLHSLPRGWSLLGASASAHAEPLCHLPHPIPALSFFLVLGIEARASYTHADM
jgi:hypothetical protein